MVVTNDDTWIDRMSISIQACSDKLKREMSEFGFPPKFPEKEEQEELKQVRILINFCHQEMLSS